MTVSRPRTPPESPGHAVPAQTWHRRALVAAVIGSALEWYDFVIYGFLAPTIGRLFFASHDATSSLLLSFATFGVGFAFRPIGAVVLGGYADVAGRKKSLVLTMLLMGGATTAIGLLPTHASIGSSAPAALALARCVQGLSAGGEFGGATAFMIEHSPADRRGFSASWQQASQAATLLLGSLVGAGIATAVSPEALDAWAWRVPFLLGAVIVPVGFYVRSRVDETPAFTALVVRDKNPTRALIGSRRRQVAIGSGVCAVWSVCMYFFLVYMPTFALRELRLDQGGALLANAGALAVLTALVPLCGTLSDDWGRKPLLLGGAAAVGALTFPLLAWLIREPSLARFAATQIVMAVAIAALTGPAPAALAELYPTAVRSSGMSLAYNGATALFGGFAPFISTWLIAATGNPIAPAAFVVAAAAVGLAAIVSMPETAHDPL